MVFYTENKRLDAVRLRLNMDKNEMTPSAPNFGPSVICVVHNKLATGRSIEFSHRIHSHCLTLMLSGTGSLQMDQIEIPSARPAMWCAPAGTMAVEKFTGPAESFYACFNWPALGLCRDGKQNLKISWNQQELLVPCIKTPDASAATGLVEVYERIRSALARQDFSGTLQSSAFLIDLFCCFLDLPSGDEKTLGHRSLLRFQRLLQKHACDHQSLEALADQAGLSADHLRLLFVQKFGILPLEYRNNLRLSKARDLLVSTDMNIKEAARHCGFVDPLYFSRAFRRRFGMSPREMIKRYRIK